MLYLGLPSPEAEDIIDWIEFIDEVIAFQCREDGKPSEVGQSRIAVKALEDKLSQFEKKGFLNNFIVYDGYIEEVLFKGKDNMSQAFAHSNTINVYNLDFCNSITSPIEFLTRMEMLKLCLNLMRLKNY